MTNVTCPLVATVTVLGLIRPWEMVNITLDGADPGPVGDFVHAAASAASPTKKAALKGFLRIIMINTSAVGESKTHASAPGSQTTSCAVARKRLTLRRLEDLKKD